MRAAVFILLLAGCSASPAVDQDRPVIPPPHTVQSTPVYRVPTTDEPASQAFLEQEIQRKGKPPEPPPAPPGGARTVYLDRYAAPGRGADPAAAFPWATAYGASVGALIGYGSDNSGEGAAIGAGIGFLFDLGRWAR